LNGDYALGAALASKAIGKPVKLVFTRPDDTRFDSPRSPSVQVVKMAFGDAGKVTAMDPCRRGRLADAGHGGPSSCPRGPTRRLRPLLGDTGRTTGTTSAPSGCGP